MIYDSIKYPQVLYTIVVILFDSAQLANGQSRCGPIHVDYQATFGLDISDSYQSSALNCLRSCEAVPICVAWTWIPRWSNCWIKHAPANLTGPYVGDTSGVCEPPAPTAAPTTRRPTTPSPTVAPTAAPTTHPTPHICNTQLHPCDLRTTYCEATPRYPTGFTCPCREGYMPTTSQTHCIETPSPTTNPTTLQPTTATPTQVPTSTPTMVPTPVPTAAPTQIPSATPTQESTGIPTFEPTAMPTSEPTGEHIKIVVCI